MTGGRILTFFWLLLCLVAPIGAGDCGLDPQQFKTLTSSTGVQGVRIRFAQYRFTVPAPEEIAPSSGLTLLIYPDRKAIGHQRIIDSGDECYTPAALYRKIFGLDALDENDDVGLFAGLAESSCGDGEMPVGYSLPEERIAVAVAKGEWYQVWLFSTDTAIDQFDFRNFSREEVEAILASLARLNR